MNNDLVERYIYAVTKRLPKKTRKDIEEELHTLISDMLEERCGDVLPTEHDIKVVLTELGTPSELAAKYSPDSDTALIGPPYYIKYKYVLMIVIPITFVTVTLAGLINFLTDNDSSALSAAINYIATIFDGLLSVFAIITLIFVFFQKRKIKLDPVSGLDDLPPVPKEKERIPLSDPIAGIIFSILFAIFFLACPNAILYLKGNLIEIFDVDKIRSMWFIILALSLIGIGREVFKIYEGRYTKRLALITVAVNLATAILTIIFISNGIINNNLVRQLENVFPRQISDTIFSNLNLAFIIILIIILTISTITTVFKALKYDR